MSAGPPLYTQTGEYITISHSRAFSVVTVEQLNQWLQLRKTETDLTVVQAVGQFCQMLFS